MDEIVKELDHGGKLVSAFAYGSGIFTQRGYDVEAQKNALLDFILVVDDQDLVDWHGANLDKFPAHYAAQMKLLGPAAIARVQRWGGGKVFFNTDVKVNEFRVKYGVITQKDLVDDLMNWSMLYVAGRLHKPVRFLKRNPPILEDALNVNLLYAMNCALCLLPEHFTEVDLFKTITQISYSGDVRMMMAENPKKVENIVMGSLPHFQALYYPRFITQLTESNVLQLKHDGGHFTQNMDPEIRQSIFTGLPFPTLMEDDPERLSRHLSAIVSKSSRQQTLKGLLTVSPLTALTYGLRKVAKRFK